MAAPDQTPDDFVPLYRAELPSYSERQRYRLAKAGKLGPVQWRPGFNGQDVMWVSREAVASFAAGFFTGKAKSATPEPQRDPLDPLTQPLAWGDLVAMARLNYETRDRQWQSYLSAKRIDVTGPKLPSVLGADLAANRFFTRAQVETLLQRATYARDCSWQDWKVDPVARAQRPGGPARFDPSDIGEER